ncbi:hypothetical protein OC835_006615 [Tilletia horrida]|nr:hypothetical protein OC835_006615 [Tilletia horrida]
MLRSEKAQRVKYVMQNVGLSLSELLEELFSGTSGVFDHVLTQWIVHRDGCSYGPLELVKNVAKLLPADGSGSSAFHRGLVAILESPLEREVQRASHVALFGSQSLVSDSHEIGLNQVHRVLDLVTQHLPLSCAMASILCGPDRSSAAGDEDEDEEELQPSSADRKGRAMTVVLSVMLNFRSQRLNRLQAAIGLILRFQHAPKTVQTLLNRLFISTTSYTSTKHLSALHKAAVIHAQHLIQNRRRVHALLFDNLDIYVRIRPGRVTSTTHIVNLTTRTLLQLPESYSAESVSAAALASLDDKRSLTEAELAGDGMYLRKSAQYFLAKELLSAVVSLRGAGGKRADSTIRLVESYVDECRQVLRIDELSAEAWTTVPLPLLEANEGTIEGTLKVLEDSSRLLGILKLNEQDNGGPTSSAAEDSAGADGEWAEDDIDEYSRTEVMPEGNLLFAVGDLKTQRNVEAALKGRSQHKRKEERLDFIRAVAAPWHLELNWVWAIFAVHFSTAKNGFAASLERLRDALRRGKTALRESEPSYNEAWALIDHVFSGWIREVFRIELSKQKKQLSSWTPRDHAAVCDLVDAVRRNVLEEASVQEARARHDEVGANARLFLRDALLALEWHDACRRGDVGRMLEAEKFLALAFAGVGKHQYSQACLDDIWASMRLQQDTWRTLMAIRLLNRCGSPKGFTGADLYQEHLNRELQRVDIAHGADKAVERLRNVFSATCESARAMRSANQDLLGASGRGRKADTRFEDDIRKIADLAKEDQLFFICCNRLSPQTLTSRVAPDSIDRRKARELLQDLMPPVYGTDAMDQGLEYLRTQGLARWESLRTPWQRYEEVLAAEVGVSIAHNAYEGDRINSPPDEECEEHLWGHETEALDVGADLDDDMVRELEERWRRKAGQRRAEEADVLGGEGEMADF